MIRNKKGCFAILCLFSFVALLVIFSGSASIAYAQNFQCAAGAGMGRGLHRGYGPAGGGFGSGPGGGQGVGMGRGRFAGAGRGGRGCPLDSQEGLSSEPAYCRMLMNRPDLNLSSEQKEALRNLQIKHTKETSDIRADLQIKKIELRKARFGKNPDFDKLKGIMEKISKLQLELQLSRLKLQIDADKVLTAEQKDSLYLAPDMAVDIEWEEEMETEGMLE